MLKLSRLPRTTSEPGVGPVARMEAPARITQFVVDPSDAGDSGRTSIDPWRGGKTVNPATAALTSANCATTAQAMVAEPCLFNADGSSVATR